MEDLSGATGIRNRDPSATRHHSSSHRGAICSQHEVLVVVCFFNCLCNTFNGWARIIQQRECVNYLALSVDWSWLTSIRVVMRENTAACQ
jgi:hypothetical protein